MNTIIESPKVMTLWGDMMPAKTTIFLVYCEDSFYRQLFCDTLKRNIEESFMGSIGMIDPNDYIEYALDDLFLFEDTYDLVIKITNEIRKRSEECLLYKELSDLFSEEIFPYEFIIVDGWKFASEVRCIEENFDIDCIIKIKLNSSKKSEEISDLENYKDFDYIFGEFSLDGGFPSDFNASMKTMLENIFLGDKK